MTSFFVYRITHRGPEKIAAGKFQKFSPSELLKELGEKWDIESKEEGNTLFVNVKGKKWKT